MVNKVERSKLCETRRKLGQKLKDIAVTDLKVLRTLAKGGHGHVSLVQLDDDPNSAFALKVIPKAKIKQQSSRDNILSEKEILCEIEHDFIIRLFRTFKDKKFLYFLTEYCPGGDLSYNRDRFPEDVAKFYVACTVEALDYLHSLEIVHNDIKPSNLVLDEEGYARLIDMGLAEKLEPGEVAFTFLGTTNFVPPEVACLKLKNSTGSKGRDRATDLWALGIMVYKFLSGSHPFQDKQCKIATQIFVNILMGIDSVHFSEEYFSAEAIDFIKLLCASSPGNRLGYDNIEEIRKHRWFKDFDWIGLRNRKLKPPVIPQIDSPIDTHYFRETVPCNLDAAVEDESDWDKDF